MSKYNSVIGGSVLKGLKRKWKLLQWLRPPDGKNLEITVRLRALNCNRYNHSHAGTIAEIRAFRPYTKIQQALRFWLGIHRLSDEARIHGFWAYVVYVRLGSGFGFRAGGWCRAILG